MTELVEEKLLDAKECAIKAHKSEADKRPVSDVSKSVLPFSFAKRKGVVLVQQNDLDVLLTLEAPNSQILSEICRFSKRPLQYKIVNPNVFSEAISHCYHENSSDALQDAFSIDDHSEFESLASVIPEAEDLMEQSDDAPVIKLINALLTEAIKEGASDIHIETFEKKVIARFRVDGVLQEMLSLNRNLAALLVSRIKVMAKLDIAEKRIPQDGRISVQIAGREVDVRVSTLPASNGERVVMRLLEKASGKLQLEHLGLSEANFKKIQQCIQSPHGIILVTGPTGSGKTTTLYASLSSLNTVDRNIMTVEDPIEYHIEGIGQTQVNAKVNMTFSQGLRAILRQDPDVVMVGEIRDKETAQIAVQASLTGHLVLSTLHTNSAIGAITRLQDMGIESFLISSSIVAVISQRLIRVLCKNCRQLDKASDVECDQLGVPCDGSIKIYRAKGCARCKYSGYRGRQGIYEIILVDNELRKLIHQGAGEQAMSEYLNHEDCSIRKDGFSKVLEGITTIEEVLRLTLV